ncbi:HD domain-containing phosphohydrolase [Niveibacterium sp. SC-1]|uniref:HD domain-containing phosphohydrolase n=1 Tax=Niveibacterium sp. SC-1 TaxID=3135646 RepID=UPI00311E7F3F
MRPSTPKRHWHLPLNVFATAASALILLVVVSLLGYEAYRGAQNALLSVTEETVGHINQTLDEKLGRILEPADNQLRLLAHAGLSDATGLDAQIHILPTAREVLEGNTLVDAFYIGFPRGEFVLFRPLRDPNVIRAVGAPEGARILMQSLARTPRGALRGQYRFYDAQLRLVDARNMPDYHFDPRTRPWYQRAHETGGTVVAEPYVFFTTRAVGITLARRTEDGAAVLGLDATMRSLAQELDRLRVTPGTEIAIVDAQQRVVAYHDAARVAVANGDQKVRLAQVNELGVPVLLRAFEHADRSGRATAAMVDGRGWRLVARPLGSQRHEGLTVLMAIPDDELFSSARDIVHRQVRVALLLIVAAVPLSWLVSTLLTRPLHRLAQETSAIESFDFTPRPLSRSRISEVDRLALATQRMKGTISNFVSTSLALGSETQLGRLLETVLANARQAADARAGVIYLFRDKRFLERAHGLSGEADELLFPASLSTEEQVAHPTVRAALERTVVADGGVRIAAPLLTRDGALVGVLDLVLAAPLKGRDDARRGFIEALAATGAVAIETRNLIDQQKALLESFIQLIAAAIDAKSHYTGGHCQRVPELAKMLAQAADEAVDGPFAGFHLASDDREALHIGAWLHDCGKVTTPEHIVDKATKLECLYDRIHEVRMRFEVLKRDAHVRALQAQQPDGLPAEAQAGLEAEWRALDEEFAFVASCNLGGEAMDETRLARLRTIGARQWLRTLDDGLGISWEEARRRTSHGVRPPPAVENLLADKPEHIVPRPPEEMLPPDNPWGFKMDVPQNTANRGELYNLSIGRGTLTTEDRYIINEHIVQTIKMLDRLPFPRHLANVPEIAGGHHERMDGKGYPKRLRREDMSVLARVMAIADVFEALTAADRPYKRPNTLSQAVAIMSRMVRDQHLDGELFELFLRSQVFAHYGERFLSPDQRDDVDVDAAIRDAGLA